MILPPRAARALLPLAALMLIAANDPPANPNDIVAQRGTVRITAGEVRDLVEHSDPAVKAQIAANPGLLANLLRERVLQLGLAAEARDKGLDQKPEMIQRMNDARESVLVQSYLATVATVEPGFPSDADVAAAYEANKTRFMIPKQFNLVQIALLVPQGSTPQADDEIRKKAADLRAQVMKPKADFGEIARKNSQERSSADKGGVIGWVREDALLPGVREAVTAMADNAISEPVRTASGWHVVKLLGTKPPAPAPLAEVREQIIASLRQARQQQAARAYVDEMLKREPIQLNEIGLARAIAPK